MAFTRTVFLLLGAAAILTAHQAVTASSNSDLIDFLKSDGYDQEVRPAGQGPTTVKLSAYIITTHGFKPDDDRSLTVNMYLRQMWTDPRLAPYVPDDSALTFSGRSPAVDLVWRPDTFIDTSRDKQQDREERFMRVKPGGEVKISQRVLFTTPCIGPDRQSSGAHNYYCDIDLESYGFSSKDIDYEWESDSAVGMSATQEDHPDGWRVTLLGQFSVYEYLTSGNYSRATIKLQASKGAQAEQVASSSTATGSSSTAAPPASSSVAAEEV